MVVLVRTLIAVLMFMSADDEANLQRALAGIYDGRDQDVVQALAAIEAGRPGFPAPAVYRALPRRRTLAEV